MKRVGSHGVFAPQPRVLKRLIPGSCLDGSTPGHVRGHRSNNNFRRFRQKIAGVQGGRTSPSRSGRRQMFLHLNRSRKGDISIKNARVQAPHGPRARCLRKATAIRPTGARSDHLQAKGGLASDADTRRSGSRPPRSSTLQASTQSLVTLRPPDISKLRTRNINGPERKMRSEEGR
jgi:hypothetical protein